MNPTNNENNSTLEAWLPYAGELVAVASAMRTASTISRRYDLSNGGMKGAATELFASWFLPSVAARSVVSYVPEALPYSKAVKGLLSILTALGIA
ncbi:MAG: hypothetical protein JSR37_07015, partial [Verrucomicrobia bacterium]|nr:hypothetical protein [Verrucomicrobiota bacterium]